MSNKVFDLLGASTPFAKDDENASLCSTDGSWDIDCTWYKRDGGTKTAKGEWALRLDTRRPRVAGCTVPVGAAPIATAPRWLLRQRQRYLARDWTRPAAESWPTWSAARWETGSFWKAEERCGGLERWCFSDITRRFVLMTARSRLSGKSCSFEQ